MQTDRICLPNELQTIVLNRKKIAKFLRLSLPTFTDWIKSALPSHNKESGFIQENKIGKLKFGSRFKRSRQQMA